MSGSIRIRFPKLLMLLAVTFTCAPSIARADLNPDFDGSCTLDSFDFLDFQSAHALLDPRADVDGDGKFTLFDFTDWMSAFAIYSEGGLPLPGCTLGSGEADLYVSPEGSGSNCSLSEPCTLNMALSKAQSGNVIDLSNGDYGDLDIDGLRYTDYVTIRANTRHMAEFSNIRIVNAAHLRLDGIANKKQDEFTGHNSGISNSENIEVLNVLLFGPGRHTNEDALSIWDSAHILVENSDISLGNRALHTNSQHVTLRGNVIHGSSGTALRIYGTDAKVENLLVENNEIFDADHEVAEHNFCVLGGPRPVWGSGACDALTGEYIHESDENPHENGLILRGVQNVAVNGNTIHSIRSGLALTVRDGPSRSTAVSGENVVITNNIVSGKFSAFTGAITARNNTITGGVSIGNSARQGTYGGLSRVDAFEGNIVGNNLSFDLCLTDTTCDGPTSVAPGAPINYNIVRAIPNAGKQNGTSDYFLQGTGNNIYYNQLYSGPPGGSTRQATPMELFIDPDQMDFRLIPGKLTSCPSDPGGRSINCGISAIDYMPVSAAPEFDKHGKARVDIPGLGSDTNIADVGTSEYQKDSGSSSD